MRKLLQFAVLAVCSSVAASAVWAADHVAALRFSSLDAVLADTERLSSVTGEGKSRQELLQNSLGPLGLRDGAWIDGTRPIVVSLPSMGLMNFGWIGAVPVKQADAALAAWEAQLGAPEVTDGLHAFPTRIGTTIHVRPDGDYLLFGQQPSVVRAADLMALLDVGELPPGSLALDLDLVPLTAMIQLGLAAGRQSVMNNLELDESDRLGREAAMEMFDLYVRFVNDTILNTSRLQLSFEVGGENLALHKRLLPREDSTLAGLLAAQKGGFPTIARRMDADSAAAVMVAGFRMTEPFRAAMREYALGYAKVMETAGTAASDDEEDWFLAMTEPWAKTAVKWVDCMRGDTAAAYYFGAESGIRVTQLAGMNRDETCGELVGDVGKALAELPDLPQGRRLVTVTDAALDHAGVQATKIEVHLLDLGEEADAEALEFMHKMFDGDSYDYYLGMKGDLLVSTMGVQADREFKNAVERLSSKKKRGGMSAKLFEPLKPESGWFMALDATRILQEIAKFDPENEDLRELEAVAGKAGRWVLGSQLHSDALRFELSMPLSALEVLEKIGERTRTMHEAP